MICARCNLPIEEGQLYHYAHRRSPADSSGVLVIVGSEPVHEYPCPERCEIVGGRMYVNGVDVGL